MFREFAEWTLSAIGNASLLAREVRTRNPAEILGSVLKNLDQNIPGEKQKIVFLKKRFGLSFPPPRSASGLPSVRLFLPRTLAFGDEPWGLSSCTGLAYFLQRATAQSESESEPALPE